MEYRGHTVSPIEFVQAYLSDHERVCRKCGYEAPMRTEWEVQKRGDEGLHFHHICPKCGAVEDIRFHPD